MRTNKLILWLFCVLMISSALIAVYYSFYLVEEVKEVPMYLKVGEIVGLNVDTDALYFGMVTRRGSSYRNITITNLKLDPVEVKIITKGELAGWVKVSEANFLLDRGESKELRFTATAPSNAEFGNYTGRALIYFKRI